MKIIVPMLIYSFLYFSAAAQVQEGVASFYADKFEGHPTASGKKYRHNKLTAAHKTLPFGTVLKVTNLVNQKSVKVTVNDRGPYIDGRIIDVSKSAAEELGFVHKGVTNVIIEVVDAGDGRSTSYPKTISHVAVEEKEYYAVHSERIAPEGFGIQIGTYQELVNMMRISDNLKTSYQKKVTVQVKVIQGVKFYSIIIGQFKNRIKAEQYLAKVKRKYPDAFLIDFGVI